MTALISAGYAARQVEKGKWTQEQADKYVADLMRVELEADENERKLVEMCRQKLKELES